MSDHHAIPARPVSLFTIVFLLAVFAAFLLVIRWFYHPTRASATSAQPENMSKELDWRATAEARRLTLAELRAKETQQVSGYAWVDKNAGVVQLPIERAMELTAQEYARQRGNRGPRDLPATPQPKL